MDKILKNFFVIAGLPASGKTTQINRVSRLLREARIAHKTTAEPSDCPAGWDVRLELYDSKTTAWELATLFARDRTSHVKWIEEACRAGHVVLCDSYYFHDLAHYSRKCGYDRVWALNANFPLPGCVIYLSVPVHTCLQRLLPRPGLDITETSVMLEDAKEYYQKALVQIMPNSTVSLNGKDDIDTIARVIYSVIKGRMVVGKSE